MNLEKHRADVASKKYLATVGFCITLEKLRVMTLNESNEIIANTYTSLCPF